MKDIGMHDELIKQLQEKYPGAETFSFGDTKALSAELLALVIEGQKTATCGALRDFEAGHEALPVVGRRDIVLGPDGAPAAVIETREVHICAFHEVDADFARDEGEGARTLENWRQMHEAYFARNGGFDPNMLLVCERFELVEVL